MFYLTDDTFIINHNVTNSRIASPVQLTALREQYGHFVLSQFRVFTWLVPADRPEKSDKSYSGHGMATGGIQHKYNINANI